MPFCARIAFTRSDSIGIRHGSGIRSPLLTQTFLFFTEGASQIVTAASGGGWHIELLLHGRSGSMGGETSLSLNGLYSNGPSTAARLLVSNSPVLNREVESYISTHIIDYIYKAHIPHPSHQRNIFF